MHYVNDRALFPLHAVLQVSYWLLGLELDGDDEGVCRACPALGRVLGCGEESGLEVEGELSGVDVDHSISQ